MSLLKSCLHQLSHQARMNWYGGHYALAQFLAPPSNAPLADPGSMPSWRRIRQDLSDYLALDNARIRRGLYKLPPDILPNPFSLAGQSLRYLKDLPALNQRRRHGRADEAAEPKRDEDYPDYFQQNFHFQTDGWFSEDSAALYDFQVEVLFVGGADAMRRQTFPALKRLIGSGDGRDIKLADIACGTGRYLREVRHNWPGLSLTGIDLSQDYLNHAARKSGRHNPIRYQQGMAEKTPLADESQDILTSIYLFHEVPKPIRRAIAAEMFRVLKPGGSLLFMDSIQIGDYEPYDALLDRFPIAFHEPYLCGLYPRQYGRSVQQSRISSWKKRNGPSSPQAGIGSNPAKPVSPVSHPAGSA